MTDMDAQLCRAVEADDLEAARHALTQGANPNATVAKNLLAGGVAMPAVCGCRSLAMLQLLLAAGGDPHCTDAGGEPIGHRLLKTKQLHDHSALVPMFSALVAAGYDLNLEGNGSRAVHWLLSEREAELLPWLVQAGADINAPDQFGETLLHKLSLRGSLDMARLAIQHGADLAAVDSEGRTPIALAREEGDMDDDEVDEFARELEAIQLAHRTDQVAGPQGELCPRCGKRGAHRCRL